MKAHSDHLFFASKEEAWQNRSSFRYSLNGLWKFSYAKNYDLAIKEFESDEVCCKSWDNIKVPAHIQMEGYDAPQYANVQYPWDGHEDIKPGEIPTAFNPVASYVKYFEVPENMKGKRVFISFQGVESGFAIWLNGTYLGYSEDSFTPSEFELTEYLKEGENKLAVRVFKWTSSSWCEDQDFFRFSGIYREVYLYAVPKVHLYDLALRTVLADDYKEGTLLIQTEFLGEEGSVEASLSYKGEEQGDVIFSSASTESGKIKVAHPKLWSAEIPRLYDLLITIKDKSGEIQEVIKQRVGFRKFEMKNAMMHLNGKRIVFKGVNRHEFSCNSGRVVSEEEMRLDIITMKQNNINAIRTCHYPDSSLIYDLCDEYGLYMIDETNLESHGTWQIPGLDSYENIVPCDNENWLDMMLDRVNSVYQRDKNHPAVVIWSCGNEAFGGKVIYEMSQKFRQLDDTRLVHYEGVFHDRRYNGTSDMESQMYPSAAAIEAFLQNDRSKPFICCEYTHAMGNSCGAMHKYTDLTDREPLYQGGFIWDYVDQSIRKKNRYGEEFQAYGGDFNDRPCDYNFSGNGIVYGTREISPKMQEVKYNYQNIGVVIEQGKARIKNKNLFLNTSIYDCIVVLEKEGIELFETQMETDVEPLGEKTYALPAQIQKMTIPGEYAVTVSFRLKRDTIWAKKGYEVAFGQNVYKIEEPAKEEKKNAGTNSFKVINGTFNIGVKGEAFEVLFSRLNGGLVSYVYGGQEMIQAIPKPNFWRAPVDNDCGNLMQSRYSQWKIASMYASHKEVIEHPTEEDMVRQAKNPTLEIQEKCAVITYTYYLPTTPASQCQLEYRVYADGTVAVKLSYDPVWDLKDMPEFGVLMKLDADYDTVEWYGMGPEETYSDRNKGAKLGIYRNKVKENLAKYLVPQETGNKVGVRYAKVMDYRGRGLLFTGNAMNFSALPYTPHELENAMHPHELPPIHYTVIRAAMNQMGVAGDDSWGARTHDEYLLDTTKKMEFEFCFKGII